MISSIIIIKAMEPAKNKQGTKLPPVEELYKQVDPKTLRSIQKVMQKFQVPKIPYKTFEEIKELAGQLMTIERMMQHHKSETQEITAEELEKMNLILKKFHEIKKIFPKEIKSIVEEVCFAFDAIDNFDGIRIFPRIEAPEEIQDKNPSKVRDLVLSMMMIIWQLTGYNFEYRNFFFRPKNRNEKEIVPGADNMWKQFFEIVPQLCFSNKEDLPRIVQRLKELLLDFAKLVESPSARIFSSELSKINFIPMLADPVTGLNSNRLSFSESIIYNFSLLSMGIEEISNHNYAAMYIELVIRICTLSLIGSRQVVEEFLDWKSIEPFSLLRDYFTALYDEKSKEGIINAYWIKIGWIKMGPKKDEKMTEKERKEIIITYLIRIFSFFFKTRVCAKKPNLFLEKDWKIEYEF